MTVDVSRTTGVEVVVERGALPAVTAMTEAEGDAPCGGAVVVTVVVTVIAVLLPDAGFTLGSASGMGSVVGGGEAVVTPLVLGAPAGLCLALATRADALAASGATGFAEDGDAEVRTAEAGAWLPWMRSRGGSSRRRLTRSGAAIAAEAGSCAGVYVSQTSAWSSPDTASAQAFRSARGGMSSRTKRT
jgi:hypothetical protein